MTKLKRGRHVPAFVLVILAEEPTYGLDIYNKLQEQVHGNTIDPAAIYRSLRDLEKSELVKYYWDTSNSGPAKKIYSITDKGKNELSEYYIDIQHRLKYLTLFMNKYKELDL